MSTEALLDKYTGDVFLYYGPILRTGYNQLSDLLEAQAGKRRRVCIVLVTNGGDPDAAYRMARATAHHYGQKIDILIPDSCKSAGTLMCIGAHRLIFGDRGELGPLDIQLSNPDEIFDSMSGLDIIQAVSALQNQVLEAFRSYLIDIRAGSGITTKMAADIAQKLTDGLVSPMAAKIDPVTLGQHQRAMNISYDYGDRLDDGSKSLKPNALIKLVSSYPSHGFVIDRKEAATLFKRVEAPDESTLPIYEYARRIVESTSYPSSPIVVDLREALESPDDEEKNDESHERSEPNEGGGEEQGDESAQPVDGRKTPKGDGNEPDNQQSNQSASRGGG